MLFILAGASHRLAIYLCHGDPCAPPAHDPNFSPTDPRSAAHHLVGVTKNVVSDGGVKGLVWISNEGAREVMRKG